MPAKKRRLQITDRVLDLFDTMQALEQQCSCGGDGRHECDVYEKWWELHSELRRELKLRPWEPAYGDYEDTNKTGALERYLALKAASDARAVSK